MKIIFLDVDGVLNDVCTPDRAPGGFIGINGYMVDNLKRIVDATDAKIVLVSTWKDDWEKDRELSSPDGRYLEDCINAKGLVIYDKTTDHISNRGEGIHNYLSGRADIESWVVLDDDVFADYEKYNIKPHLVQTRFSCGGLTIPLSVQAIEILNQQQY